MKWLRLVFFISILSLFMTGCAGCGDDVAGPGESCDAELDEPCEDDALELVCTADEDGANRCLQPAGARCNEGDDLCEPNAGCEDSEDDGFRCLWTESATCDPDQDLCSSGLECAELEDGEHACHHPLEVQGFVFDAETLDAIADAHVIAFDEERSALSDVAVTDENGEYALNIPAVRDEEGAPIQQMFTLRVGAQDYQTFPGGIREAQPIDASHSDDVEDLWIIDTAQTDVALLELPEDQRGFPQISGVVDIEGGLGGVLVVAEPQGVDHEAQDSPPAYSGVSGLDGSFVIFNVSSGDYDVRGFIADYQIEEELVEIDADDVDDIVLVRSQEGVRDVSGKIQIVRGSGETSVILMVASTFDEMTVRGEVPAGLRAPRTGAPSVTNDWLIEGVPAGEYIVMAAFENDELVRSPDEGIAGTEIIRIEVPEGDGEFNVGESFKIVGALPTVGPGSEGPESLSERPILQWGPIENADHYDVAVFDAFGNTVFEDLGIDHQGGVNVYESEYTGPFDDGMYYQFRVVSYRGDSANSSTEFLRGVFYRQ